jgi:hypothetical protein
MMESRKLVGRRWSVVTGQPVVVKARKEIYMTMYEISKEHAELAKQAAGMDIHKNMNPEIKESMVSILFAYTCLEAYINTIGKDRLGSDWPRYKASSTEAKWMGVSKALASKKSGKPNSVFNKGEEPFKSFLKLEKIREDYLIHRKAEFGDVVRTKYGMTEGTVNVLNCDKADWACKTVRDMVSKLNESIDNPPSASWLD